MEEMLSPAAEPKPKRKYTRKPPHKNRVYVDHAARQKAYEERQKEIDAVDYVEQYPDIFVEERRELSDFFKASLNTIKLEMAGREVETREVPTGTPHHVYGQIVGFTPRKIYSGDGYEETVEQLCALHLAFSKRTKLEAWVRNSNAGVIAAGFVLTDQVGEQLVFHANYFGLKQSPTFTQLYGVVLAELERRFGEQHTAHSRTVRRELIGEYRLDQEQLPSHCQEAVPEHEGVVLHGKGRGPTYLATFEEYQFIREHAAELAGLGFDDAWSYIHSIRAGVQPKPQITERFL